MGLSAARTEVRGESLAGEKNRSRAGAGDRPSKDEAHSAISPADVNGHFDDAVPDWVQKEPVHGAPGQRQAGGQQAVGVVGEVGSITHGTGGFQTRATPRTVFRQAEETSGRPDQDAAAGSVGGRPPRPPAGGGGGALSEAKGGSEQAWVQIDPGKGPPGKAADQEDAAANGVANHVGADRGVRESLVQDGDARCVAGASVAVSDRWLHVPYFKQFTGLHGKLTRRGVNGATWYATFPGWCSSSSSSSSHVGALPPHCPLCLSLACFHRARTHSLADLARRGSWVAVLPGCPEQAFSTGMHGQFILCYSPVYSGLRPSLPAPARLFYCVLFYYILF